MLELFFNLPLFLRVLYGRHDTGTLAHESLATNRTQATNRRQRDCESQRQVASEIPDRPRHRVWGAHGAKDQLSDGFFSAP